jgi:hypothetical protein
LVALGMVFFARSSGMRPLPMRTFAILYPASALLVSADSWDRALPYLTLAPRAEKFFSQRFTLHD